MNKFKSGVILLCDYVIAKEDIISYEGIRKVIKGNKYQLLDEENGIVTIVCEDGSQAQYFNNYFY